MPEIERKEVALRAERERLQVSQTAVGVIESAIEELRLHSDDPATD